MPFYMVNRERIDAGPVQMTKGEIVEMDASEAAALLELGALLPAELAPEHFTPAEPAAGVADIVDAAAAVDDGEGVILLTDMFGGTPSNLAISVMEQTRAEVIAGLNLPMLIKLASVRGRETLEACVAHAQDAGRKYISVASWVLAGEK